MAGVAIWRVWRYGGCGDMAIGRNGDMAEWRYGGMAIGLVAGNPDRRGLKPPSHSASRLKPTKNPIFNAA